MAGADNKERLLTMAREEDNEEPIHSAIGYAHTFNMNHSKIFEIIVAEAKKAKEGKGKRLLLAFKDGDKIIQNLKDMVRDCGTVMPVSLLITDPKLLLDKDGGYKLVQKMTWINGYIGLPFIILSVWYGPLAKATPLLPGRKLRVLSIQKNNQSAQANASKLGWKKAGMLEGTPTMTSSLEAMTYLKTLDGPLSDHYDIVLADAKLFEGEGTTFLDWMKDLFMKGLRLPMVVSMKINKPLPEDQDNPQLTQTRKILEVAAMVVGSPIVAEYAPYVNSLI